MSDGTIEERIDVSFPLGGSSIPRDHGYSVFSAMSRTLGPMVHGAKWLAVHPVRGTPRDDRSLALIPGKSALTLRVPPVELLKVLPLAGTGLDIAGHPLLLGTSRVYPIDSAKSLKSRLVVIKGFTEPAPFLEAVRRQLDALGVSAGIELVRRAPRDGNSEGDVWRRVIRIAGDTVVGFGVKLSGLDEGGSKRIQHAGVGGRQRFGCGVFIPDVRTL